ncbi:hypothetical protein A1O1_07788 [Capronia coronata CBS 617.96]|uniref:Uncharacterized protein n=1 Tax=Capronia coronata CBS 617.96 TaxID=1182541 RepID=W9XNB6_9EURO|nr:uncharacterized protein A1O1_07788 [Capronia coronata CBS 617.96]EXJ81723.1 hypothetical protein A1O1_07788 [Capronia coronata CBS 617.96]
MSNLVQRTKSDLDTLFTRFPDIKFDEASNLIEETHDKEHFSSPCSNNTDHDESLLSIQSTSTANTTPLRPMPRAAEALDVPNLADFLQHVDSTDLPAICKDWLKSLGRQVFDLARILLPTSRDVAGHANSHRQEILDQSRPILVQLQDVDNRLQEQVRNIAYIKSLAPFVVEPAPQDTWTIYRQRAKLIVNYTALPSGTERKALVHLARIFDAYVYHPFLQLLGFDSVDADVQNRTNELYDNIMKLLQSYGQWWKGMKSIRYDYMLPLMRRIRSSPEILREIKEFEKAKEAARAVIGNVDAPGMQPVDRSVLRQLNAKSPGLMHALLPASRIETDEER